MDYTKCDSTQDLERKLDCIFSDLSLDETEDSWSKIDASLKNLASLSIAGALKYPVFVSGLESNSSFISRSILTERTRLSGTALDFISTLSQQNELKFRQVSNLFVHDIIKLCAPSKNSSKILRSNVSKVLLTAIQEIGTGDSGFSDPAKEKAEASQYFEAIESTIACTAVDAEVTVRSTAKTIYEVYTTKYPENKDKLVEKLDTTAKKYLKITSGSSTQINRPGRQGISEARRLMAARRMNPGFMKSIAVDSEQKGLLEEAGSASEKTEELDNYKPQAVRRVPLKQQTRQSNTESQTQGAAEVPGNTNINALGKDCTTMCEDSSAIFRNKDNNTTSAATPADASTSNGGTSSSEPKENFFERAPLLRRISPASSSTAIVGEPVVHAVPKSAQRVAVGPKQRFQVLSLPPTLQQKGREMRRRSIFRARQLAIAQQSPYVGILSTQKQRIASRRYGHSSIDRQRIGGEHNNEVARAVSARRLVDLPTQRSSCGSVNVSALAPNRVRSRSTSNEPAHVSAHVPSHVSSRNTTRAPVRTQIVPVTQSGQKRIPIHLRTTASSRQRILPKENRPLRSAISKNKVKLSILGFALKNPKSPLVKKFIRVSAKFGVGLKPLVPKSLEFVQATPKPKQRFGSRIDELTKTLPTKINNQAKGISFFSPSLNKTYSEKTVVIVGNNQVIGAEPNVAPVLVQREQSPVETLSSVTDLSQNTTVALDQQVVETAG
ncbi:hypothetical protein BB560_005956, partial [Smittium megazygosporum]